MSDQMASKPMGLLLQDPTLRDGQGEYLHTNYHFSLDEDFLVATGSSKFMIRDEDENGVPLFSGSDWGDPSIRLAYEDFNRRPLERPIRDDPQFHQVNVFAAAAHTLSSFEEALGREITWRHGGPLVIRPHAMEDANAYYTPFTLSLNLLPSLNFGYFDSRFRPETVWTCLSHDIVAHELGHAILDSFRPLFFFSFDLDAQALHESVGDLFSLFSALEHPPLVERLYRRSGGDMRRPTFISSLAEEFGEGLEGSGTSYLRSALKGPSYDQAPEEAHARSTTWTAAMYEILVDFVATLVPADPQTRESNFEDFKQAVAKATSLTRAMLIRALQYTAPTGVTMPVLARLVYEADKRLFPDDSKLRDIAKRVFKQRRLWDENIVLDAPGIGHAFEEFEAAGPAARARMARMVVNHADALRIPLGLGPRMLTPHLVTATRQISTAEEGERTADNQAVTERYLYFGYELTDTIVVSGPNGFEPAPVVISLGGTLVMDKDFNDLALVTDPPAVAADLRKPDPAIGSLERATDRFREFHGGILYEGSVFRLERRGAGPARLVGRHCNMAEHLHAISQPEEQFSFASRLGLDYPGMFGAFDPRGYKRKITITESGAFDPRGYKRKGITD